MSIYAPKKPKLLNSLNVSIFTVGIVLAYFGTWYLPHWYREWTMGGVLVTIGRDAYREHDDEKLMKKLVNEGRRVGLRVTEKNFVLKREQYSQEYILQQQKKGAYVDLLKRRGKSITVAFAVKVQADWPLIDKSTELILRDQKTVDLATITW